MPSKKTQKHKRKKKIKKLSFFQKIKLVVKNPKFLRLKIVTLALIISTIFSITVNIKALQNEENNILKENVQISESIDHGTKIEEAGDKGYVWAFENSNDYNYDNEFIEINSNIASTVAFDQKDDDNSSTKGFNAGSHSNTQYDDSNNWLELDATGQSNGSGVYTSRIMDSSSSTQWDTLTWKPQQPTFKELPGNQEKESGYSSGNADMAGNVLLAHLNDSSGAILDDSGNNNNGTYNGSLYGQTGKLNTAMGLDGSNDHITFTNVPVNTSSGAQNTVEFWMYWNGSSGRMPMGWNTSYDLWFSGGCFGFNTGQSNVFGISSSGLSNQWVHVAAVFYNGVPSGSNNELYINGSKQSIYSCQGSTTASRSVTSTVSIGTWMSGSGYYFGGSIDEFAIFNRKLSSQEVENHYKRGALKMKHQVRSCDDAVCSGESFQGPDGTSSTYYSELTNSTLTPPSQAITNLSDNQYFQYRTTLETSNSSLSPELVSIEISPAHYPTTSPTVSNKNGIGAKKIISFSETLGSNNQGNLSYQVSPNGTNWYYFNGASWQETTSSTNTVSQINDNISSFLEEVSGEQFFFKAFFNEDSPLEKVSLDKISIQYSQEEETPAPIPESETIASPQEETESTTDSSSTSSSSETQTILQNTITSVSSQAPIFSIQQNSRYDQEKHKIISTSWLVENSNVVTEYKEGDYATAVILNEEKETILEQSNITINKEGLFTFAWEDFTISPNEAFIVMTYIFKDSNKYTSIPQEITSSEIGSREVSGAITQEQKENKKNIEILTKRLFYGNIINLIGWIIVIVMVAKIFLGPEEELLKFSKART